MLKDLSGIKEIYIVCGFTDLRLGIEGLAGIVKGKYGKSPFVPNVLYLFCGRKADRFKALIWEEDGFLLLYKRLAMGSFRWPRNAAELRNISYPQFRQLLDGFTIESSIKKVSPEQLA